MLKEIVQISEQIKQDEVLTNLVHVYFNNFAYSFNDIIELLKYLPINTIIIHCHTIVPVLADFSDEIPELIQEKLKQINAMDIINNWNQ